MSWQLYLVALGVEVILTSTAFAQVKSTTSEFPAVSTLLDENETSRLQAFVRTHKDSDSCFRIGSYFSAAQGSWTYRIVGRARALEVYRQLVLAGIKPHDIDIRSLGPIDETREYKRDPSSRSVMLDVIPKSEAPCSRKAYVARASAKSEATTQLSLDYEMLDADPHRQSLEAFKDLIHANADANFLEIVSYSDFTGSTYLNRVLSRLRSLILFRIATLEGVPPGSIHLDWKGKVMASNPNLPPPIIDAQRRALARWSKQQMPLKDQIATTMSPESKIETPPETALAAPVPEPASSSGGKIEASDDSADEETRHGHRWDLGFRLGLATPPSSVKSDLKNALRPELFARSALAPDGGGWGLELFASTQNHRKTVNSQIAGDVGITRIGLSVNYSYALSDSWNLLASGGLLIADWEGDTRYQSNDESHSESGRDISPSGAVGLQTFLGSNLFMEARTDLSYSKASLDGRMAGLSLGMGWRF